jgi:sRNA-binding protein
MTSEWMKVMLEEIARKQAEAAEARLEALRRREEQQSGEEPRSSSGEEPRSVGCGQAPSPPDRDLLQG